MGKTNFEDDLKRLEEIGKELKDGTVELESATRLFQEGITLSKKLDRELRTMEKRIETVLAENDADEEEPMTKPFEEV